MPLVKIKHIISFSSQDPKYTVENLVKGSGPWLSSCDDHSGSLRAEFQMEKVAAIEYIDIGNSNTAMVSIEVGRSTWPSSQPFQTLLPTVVLMSPTDRRSGKNSKSVRMFKKEDMNGNAVSQKWDRIRVICTNPFRMDSQYGLEFLKLYTQEDGNKTPDVTVTASFSPGEQKIKSKFLSYIAPKSSELVMPSSVRSLETYRVNNAQEDCSIMNDPWKEVRSPVSRAAKLVMARKLIPNQGDAIQEKKELEMAALRFLISLQLTKDDINSLRVSHIREQFEVNGNRSLSTREKHIFKNIALDFAAEKLKKLDAPPQDDDPDFDDFIDLAVESDKPRTFKFKCMDKNFPCESNKDYNSPITDSIINSGNCKDIENSSEIVSSVLKQPLSAKRAKLRAGEIITSQRPVGIERNSLALEDCNITPKSTIRKRKKTEESTSSNLGVWLCQKVTPEKRTFTEKYINSPSKKRAAGRDRSTDIVIDNTSSDSDVECDPADGYSISHETSRSSGYTLDQKPTDKYGVNKNSAYSSGPSSPIDMHECPICTGLFPSDLIEEHASQCVTDSSFAVKQNEQETAASMEECPICEELFDTSSIKVHAEECADKHFT